MRSFVLLALPAVPGSLASQSAIEPPHIYGYVARNGRRQKTLK
jgi:hypothetical protein